MARSMATSVAEYLRGLPAEPREALAGVRSVIRKHLPRGYKETMRWGMIVYEIPLARHPDTYNGQPLCYAGLAAQKGCNAVYLTGVHQDPRLSKRLREGFKSAGKKLAMGPRPAGRGGEPTRPAGRESLRAAGRRRSSRDRDPRGAGEW